MHHDGDITELVHKVEDLCKRNDNTLKQLLYEDMSTAGTRHTNRGDTYNALGGPILVVLYYINAIPKAATCRKLAKAARTDSIYYMKAPTSLVTAIMGGIKS